MRSTSTHRSKEGRYVKWQGTGVYSSYDNIRDSSQWCEWRREDENAGNRPKFWLYDGHFHL